MNIPYGYHWNTSLYQWNIIDIILPLIYHRSVVLYTNGDHLNITIFRDICYINY